jgi:hypothetical protein
MLGVPHLQLPTPRPANNFRNAGPPLDQSFQGARAEQEHGPIQFLRFQKNHLLSGIR